MIKKALEYQASDALEMSFTPNMHSMLHWLQVITAVGSSTSYWCFVEERNNGRLKKLYRNTNNRDTAVTVFKRYQTGRYF
jgi:hypothetical protein